jgi:hypothetical protein
MRVIDTGAKIDTPSQTVDLNRCCREATIYLAVPHSLATIRPRCSYKYEDATHELTEGALLPSKVLFTRWPAKPHMIK